MEKTINVEAAGVQVYTGSILELNPGESVLISYKQPRRPKPSEINLMWSDVIAVVGSKGETGQVIAKSLSVELFNGKGSIKKIEPNSVTAEVGGTMVTANPNNCRVFSFIDKADGETSTKTKANKGGKKSKPGKVLKKKKKK
jgi:hypothetical protein